MQETTWRLVRVKVSDDSRVIIESGLTFAQALAARREIESQPGFALIVEEST